MSKTSNKHKTLINLNHISNWGSDSSRIFDVDFEFDIRLASILQKTSGRSTKQFTRIARDGIIQSLYFFSIFEFNSM